MNISKEEYYRRMAALVYDPTGPEVQIASETIARQLEEEAIAREIATTSGTPPLPNVRPVISTPTASSPALPIECVAEYLNSVPRRTAKALENNGGVDRMKKPRNVTDDWRCDVAFYLAGNMAMSYWRREDIEGTRLVMHTDRFGASSTFPLHDLQEWDLMVLLAGPMAEFFRMGLTPSGPHLFRNDYQDSNSALPRIRNLVKSLRGKDDRRYLIRIQERCRQIIQEPRMWGAITMMAERLMADNEISAEECESILSERRARQYLGDDYARYPVIQLPLGIKWPDFVKLDDQGVPIVEASPFRDDDPWGDEAPPVTPEAAGEPAEPVAAVEPSAAPAADDPVILRRKILEILAALPNLDWLSASEIHAAICPAMDVAELDLLLQGLGCNSVIEMMENGGKYEYWAKEPDEPVASEIVAESEPGQLSVCEQQILDVLAAYRRQDGQPDWMLVEELESAVGWGDVHGGFSMYGLQKAGYILYESRRGGPHGDAAYYRISERALPAEVPAEEDEEFPFDAAAALEPSLVQASIPSQPPSEGKPVARSDVERTPDEGGHLEANPYTSNNRNTVGSKRTGVRYELGKEDAEYLADVLEIAVMDARAILRDVDGANGYQVLRVVMPSIANILKSRNRAAYVRAIVRAKVERIKAQNPDPQAHNTQQKLSTIHPAIPPARKGA